MINANKRSALALLLVFLYGCSSPYSFTEDDNYRIERFTFQYPEGSLPSDEVLIQAEQGDFPAQYSVGVYYRGQRSGEARDYLVSAGENGITDAFYHLGMLYFDGYMIRGGSGVSSLVTIYASLSSDRRSSDPDLLYISYETAFKYLEQAAESGNIRAQNAVGFMLKDGIGVEQNIELSCRWFEKSHLSAYAMGSLNYAACLTGANRISALKAAADVNALAAFELGLEYQIMDELQQTLSLTESEPETSEEPSIFQSYGVDLESNYDSIAASWFKTSADLGYQVAIALGY